MGFELPKKEETYKTSRRTGVTTRTADALIQELFKNGIIDVYDHAQSDHNMARDYLKKVIVRRMQIEHPHVMLILSNDGRDRYRIAIADMGQPEETVFKLTGFPNQIDEIRRNIKEILK